MLVWGAADNDADGPILEFRDGATTGNGEVENWFELLDSWFDDTSGDAGGLNGHRW